MRSIEDPEVKKDSNLEIKKSAFDGAKDFFNLDTVKRSMRIVSDVYEAVYPAIEKPTWTNIARAAFTMGKIAIEDMEVWSEMYFDEEWSPLYSEDFNKIVLKALASKKYKTIKTSEKTYNIRIVDVDGLRFGYIYNSRFQVVGSIFARTDELDKAKDCIKNLLWEIYKDSNLILRNNKKSKFLESESKIGLEPDDAFESMTSKRAEDYSVYLKKCLNANVPRSVMLYGPPGTGKSTMARTIVDLLGLRSFRIRVEDVGHIETSTIFEAIDIFQPDAIILDDFDRSNNQASLLEVLEFFKQRVKLVIATVNNRNQLDEAILRPGRFDELIHIKQMDEDVVKILLGEEMADAFETVKDWPIAFIQEYAQRRKFMNAQEAEESTRELAARVKRLEKYEDEDEDSTLNVISRKKHKLKKNFFDESLETSKND